MMRQRQLPSLVRSTEPASIQTDNSAGQMHHSNLSQTPPSCITVLYAKMTKQKRSSVLF